MSEQAQDAPIELPDFDGRFRDVVLIRERNITRTFRAIEPQTGRAVFIKLLHVHELEKSLAERLFCYEPALLRALSKEAPHVPILPVLEMGRWQELPYFVQPLLTGWSLEEAAQRHVCFTGPAVVRVVESCLEFLAALHDAGVIHGDISPDNIFIETAEPFTETGTLPAGCNVHLLDFNGARRIAGLENNGRGTIFFKPAFAAPEIVRTRVLTPQTDLFSLGAVMYQMLTGAFYQAGQAWTEDARAPQHDSPTLALLFAVPALIEEFMRALLNPDPQQRLASAAEALRRLRGLKAIRDWLTTDSTADLPGRRLLPATGARLRLTITSRPAQSTPWPPHTIPAPTQIVPYDSETTIPPTRPSFYQSAPLMVGSAAPRGQDYSPLSSASLAAPAAAFTTGASHAPLAESDRRMVSTAYNVPVPAREQEIDLVQFSVFAPATVPPGRSFVLEAWAFLREQRAEVVALATRHGQLLERGSRANVRVPTRTELTLVLRLDGFEVRDPQDSFFWCGEFVNSSFIVDAPSELKPGNYPGQITIMHGGLLLTRLVFEVTVGDALAEPAKLGMRQEQFKTAFASYASADRAEVLRRVQGLNAAGVDVFLDVLTLRAGQDWEAQLHENIRRRDIFYLFWSEAARTSDWVEREWRYALDEKGLDYIHPIPLVDPRLAPPPPELASRHFNDLLLACLNSHTLATSGHSGPPAT